MERKTNKGIVLSGALPGDVRALSDVYSFTPTAYTDFRQTRDLEECVKSYRLFSKLPALLGKKQTPL